MSDLTCHEVVDSLADYLAGDLPREERSRFDRHLADCRACGAFLRSYAGTVHLARHAYDDDGMRP